MEIIWDQTWPLLRLYGQGTKIFLQGQTTSNILNFKEGVIYHTCWLTATGRVKAILEVKLTPIGADIIVLSGNINDVANGFDRVIFPADKISLEPLSSIRRIQILSEDSSQRLENISFFFQDQTIPLNLQKFPKADEIQIELWRVSHALPLGLGEINGKYNPFELGLSNLVSLDKGCYLGQETLAKVSNTGGVKQSLRCWRSEGKPYVGQGLIITSSEANLTKGAGVVTSLVKDPKSKTFFGLAMIRKKAWLENNLLLSNESTMITLSAQKDFPGFL